MKNTGKLYPTFKTLKGLMPLLLSALVMVLTAPAFASNGFKSKGHEFYGPKCHCKVLGSWMGYYTIDPFPTGDAWWVSTITGQNAEHGISILDIPGFDPTITVDGVPTFPDAVKSSALRGVWERTGPYSYAYTLVGFTLDSNGGTQYISKLTGTETLSEDCNTMLLQNTYLQIYLPDADPFSDTPIIGPLYFPDHNGYRMKIDLP
jgi:hypothetical protein